MSTERTPVQEQIGDLLATARETLHLSLAFLSRMDGVTQHLEVVECSLPVLFKDGKSYDQASSLCQAIWDDKLPAVIPDLRHHPEAMKLPAARMPRLRSYVSVPVVLSDGTRYGTFCAAGFTSDKALSKRDKALMDVLARAAATLIEPELIERTRRAEIEGRLLPVLTGQGLQVHVQPIVSLATGLRVGVEALSRFPAEWHKAPDVVFEEAHSIGLGHELELRALSVAAGHLERLGGYVAMNVSPRTLLSGGVADLLALLPLERVLLELCEQDAVGDYDRLHAVLAPLRAAGMRLAIDDVGAGFSSLRHIVLTRPDVLKIDGSVVSGVDADPVLQTLVRSLTDFGHSLGATVVAEGIEYQPEAEALASLGVDLGQGWLFGRPGSVDELAARGSLVPAPRGGSSTLHVA